ncbi:hypothetical protein QP178_17390 [Sphingomonas aurantiaca]
MIDSGAQDLNCEADVDSVMPLHPAIWNERGTIRKGRGGDG